MVKRNILITGLLLVAFLTSNAVGQKNFQGIGVAFGPTLFVGDSKLMDSSLGPKLGVYTVFRYSPKLSFRLQAGYSKIIAVSGTNKKVSTMLPVELVGMYSFSKMGSFLPFLHAGLGGAFYSVDGSPWNNHDGFFIAGGGFDYPLSDRLNLLVSADLRYTTSDNFNVPVGGLNDGYATVQVGLTYKFEKGKARFEREEQKPAGPIVVERPGAAAEKEPAKDDVYLQIVQLKSKIEALQDQLDQKDAQIEELKALLKIKDGKIELLQAQVTQLKKERAAQPPRTYAEATRPKMRTASGVKARYDAALQLFNSRQYKDAMQELMQLYNEYPNHFLASNFIYWIGECHFALKNYAAAIEAFENVLNQFKRSYKHDDALIMAGIAYLKLGNADKAAQKFQELLQKFPGSEYAGKARKLLKSIRRDVIS